MSGFKKYSRKREAVFEKLSGTTSHPTAEWLYEELKKEIPDLSLGTVYRNLSVFKDEGLIISVGVVNGQERFDANTCEHSHFVCLDCGGVFDIDAHIEPSFNDEIARRNNIDVLFRQLNFYGKCKQCGSKQESTQENNIIDGGKLL